VRIIGVAYSIDTARRSQQQRNVLRVLHFIHDALLVVGAALVAAAPAAHPYAVAVTMVHTNSSSSSVVTLIGRRDMHRNAKLGISVTLKHTTRRRHVA
jgi:hypothetical protein